MGVWDEVIQAGHDTRHVRDMEFTNYDRIMGFAAARKRYRYGMTQIFTLEVELCKGMLVIKVSLYLR